jgi:3-oxoacyl-[acyl-carrier protein] reductase
VAQIIADQGGEAFPVKASVADSEAVKNNDTPGDGQRGKIDILVNNAGITRDGLLPRMSDEAWEDVSAQSQGAYLCTKLALRSMMTQSWGRIINIASLEELRAMPARPTIPPARAGLSHLPNRWHGEVGSRNITANVIAPGFFLTDMTKKLPPEAIDAILERIPLKRYGTRKTWRNWWLPWQANVQVTLRPGHMH